MTRTGWLASWDEPSTFPRSSTRKRRRPLSVRPNRSWVGGSAPRLLRTPSSRRAGTAPDLRHSGSARTSTRSCVARSEAWVRSCSCQSSRYALAAQPLEHGDPYSCEHKAGHQPRPRAPLLGARGEVLLRHGRPRQVRRGSARPRRTAARTSRIRFPPCCDPHQWSAAARNANRAATGPTKMPIDKAPSRARQPPAPTTAHRTKRTRGSVRTLPAAVMRPACDDPRPTATFSARTATSAFPGFAIGRSASLTRGACRCQTSKSSAAASSRKAATVAVARSKSSTSRNPSRANIGTAARGPRRPLLISQGRAKNEEVVPVNVSTWVLPSGVTVGR